eukprot:m.257629 g.257629  ORF g.257629 m.257629 type:complete len:654 (-) comp20985_c0_seq1:171-2132(-)
MMGVVTPRSTLTSIGSSITHSVAGRSALAVLDDAAAHRAPRHRHVAARAMAAFRKRPSMVVDDRTGFAYNMWVLLLALTAAVGKANGQFTWPCTQTSETGALCNNTLYDFSLMLNQTGMALGSLFSSLDGLSSEGIVYYFEITGLSLSPSAVCGASNLSQYVFIAAADCWLAGYPRLISPLAPASWTLTPEGGGVAQLITVQFEESMQVQVSCVPSTFMSYFQVFTPSENPWYTVEINSCLACPQGCPGCKPVRQYPDIWPSATGGATGLSQSNYFGPSELPTILYRLFAYGAAQPTAVLVDGSGQMFVGVAAGLLVIRNQLPAALIAAPPGTTAISQPIIVDGLIAVVLASNTSASLVFYNATAIAVSVSLPAPTTTPAATQAFLVGFTANRTCGGYGTYIFCASNSTGVVWSHDNLGEIRAAVLTDLGGALVITASTAAPSPDPQVTMISLDPLTGAILWRAAETGFDYASTILATRVFSNNKTGTVLALSNTTGSFVGISDASGAVALAPAAFLEATCDFRPGLVAMAPNCTLVCFRAGSTANHLIGFRLPEALIVFELSVGPAASALASSVVIVDGNATAYYATPTAASQTLSIGAIDTHTGTRLWNTTVAGASAALSLDGTGNLIVLALNGDKSQLYAFGPAAGAQFT